MTPLPASLPKIRKISMSLYLELMNGTLYGKDSPSVVKDLEMGQLCWTTWVSPKCNNKCLYKREAEEDLTEIGAGRAM